MSINKIIDKELQDFFDKKNREGLESVAKSLPLWPPLKSGGDATVRDILPQMTDDDIDYIMSKYKGKMKRG
ncbi:MAG: hypothetical protein WCK35_17675 [Chloroflexota bacterium]